MRARDKLLLEIAIAIMATGVLYVIIRYACCGGGT